MKQVLITAPYKLREKSKLQLIFKQYPIQVTWADVKERLDEDELLNVIPGVEGIICGDDQFTSKVYEKAKNLKVVVKWGTGVDSIKIKEAEKFQIQVFRTPDAFTDPVADTTLGYILVHVRGLLTNDKILKDGGWDKPQGYALFEKTVGIIGLGSIGNAVAKRLKAFSCPVLGYDIQKKDSLYDVKITSLEELLQTVDIITLHCDLNPSSSHILNEESFASMKRKPYIVNTARGPLIDENALIKALVSGMIVGAALDVFEHEPLSLDSPLRRMDNVLLASHNSNSSPFCWDRVHHQSIKMLLEGLSIE